jgi:hypothetical protein
MENYLDSNSVAYHYESKTRNDDPDNLKKLKIDSEKLLPFINENINKLLRFFTIK